jgi:hypothetical protein
MAVSITPEFGGGLKLKAFWPARRPHSTIRVCEYERKLSDQDTDPLI